MDITLCDGGGCPAKHLCKRYLENSTYLLESKFPTPPYAIDREKFECDFFMGDSGYYLLEQLKSIFNK